MYKSTKQLVVYGLREFYLQNLIKVIFRGDGELTFEVKIKESIDCIGNLSHFDIVLVYRHLVLITLHFIKLKIKKLNLPYKKKRLN